MTSAPSPTGATGATGSTGATGERERRLRWFNELSQAEAVGALLLVCHSRPFAEQVAAKRPFPGVGALEAEADAVWLSLTPADWLEALDAHPRIGESGGSSPSWSSTEQAGVSAAGEDVQAAIARGNAEYEARFGHVFLIAAAGLGAEEILGQLRSRLGNDPDVEVRVAAQEHRRITRLRLERLMAE
jgi:OHCU decarboxylase